MMQATGAAKKKAAGQWTHGQDNAHLCQHSWVRCEGVWQEGEGDGQQHGEAQAHGSAHLHPKHQHSHAQGGGTSRLATTQGPWALLRVSVS